MTMTLKPMSRSVSIIGVGMTKYGDPADTPEIKGMSLQDLAAWAALSAMEDAGVNPRQVDRLVMGMACSSYYNSDTMTPVHGFLEFVGMKGKAGVYHNEACATAQNCFDEAVTDVASGRYDIAICVDTDSTRYFSEPEKPSCYRHPSNEYKQYYGRNWGGGATAIDTAYIRWTGATYAAMDSCGRHYIRNTGVTADELDDATIGAAITARHHGALDPFAYARDTWEAKAKERGYDDAKAYLKSKYNPKVTEYLRPSGIAVLDEGAAAVVVCATDIAKKFKQQPIEVVNIAQCDMSVLTPNVEQRMTRGAIKQLYDATGYKPEDIEYLQTTDMDVLDLVDSAEAVGYLPQSEGWKYFRDGRTSFDKDKPINTNGGTFGVGHAFAATPMAGIVETVWQMRGQAGQRQIPKPPRVAMVRLQGGNQSVSISILKTSGVPKGGAEPKMGTPKFKPQPLVKQFYEGLDKGKFLGTKCPACGNVEFPPYPACNKCGTVCNDLVELSGDVTVDEVFAVPPIFTTEVLAPYKPVFSTEAQLAEGAEITCLLFGVTPETYEKTRDSVPLKGKLVVMPNTISGFNTFAVGINGAVPIPKAVEAKASEEFDRLRAGRFVEKS